MKKQDFSKKKLQPKALHNFYKSSDWRKVREEVILRANGLCELCGKPGTEVHHKIHLTLENLNDRDISLNTDNLLLLCRDCHNLMHDRFNKPLPKYVFNEDGDLVEVNETKGDRSR